MTVKCAFCGHEIADDVGPVEYDGDGLPYALAVEPGYGVPWARGPVTYGFEIMLDGKVMDSVVAFDRRRGFVVRIAKINGAYVMHGDALQVEKLQGSVRVRSIT